MIHQKIHLIGYASDIGGATSGAGHGPILLHDSAYILALKKKGLEIHWCDLIKPSTSFSEKYTEIKKICEKLSSSVAALVQENKFFTVFGGDHTSGIGTWSGASVAKKSQGDIGLIWIDAHMDSHTPKTSETGNIHGMPLACLLGHGHSELTQLSQPFPKLKPENICLIGVRSFEKSELELLEHLKIRIFFMDEIHQKGLNIVLQEAIKIVTQKTIGYGITIDIDSIDPIDAPGTGVVEKNGIPGKQLCDSLTLLSDDSRLMGTEIAEFDPSRDKNQITEKLIAQMLAAITLGTWG